MNGCAVTCTAGYPTCSTIGKAGGYLHIYIYIYIIYMYVCIIYMYSAYHYVYIYIYIYKNRSIFLCIFMLYKTAVSQPDP